MKLPPAWEKFLPDQSKRLQHLGDFLEAEKQSGEAVYPSRNNIFRALEMPPDEVRVVLLGQDPYHGEGQANGLAFSVPSEVPLPPSLRNMFRELHDDLGGPLRKDGDLLDWHDQGVLLLNRTLTVRSGQAASHRGQGWEEITADIVDRLSREKGGLVFLLLGGQAAEVLPLIDEGRQTIIQAPHPSPLSAYRGFFGSRIWSRTNQALQRPIRWI